MTAQEIEQLIQADGFIFYLECMCGGTKTRKFKKGDAKIIIKPSKKTFFIKLYANTVTGKTFEKFIETYSEYQSRIQEAS